MFFCCLFVSMKGIRVKKVNTTRIVIKEKGGVRNVKWSWVENGRKIRAKIVSDDRGVIIGKIMTVPRRTSIGPH